MKTVKFRYRDFNIIPKPTDLSTFTAERTQRLYPDQIPSSPGITYTEGAVERIEVNRYERNPAARAACIEHHGTRCRLTCRLALTNYLSRGW